MPGCPLIRNPGEDFRIAGDQFGVDEPLSLRTGPGALWAAVGVRVVRHRRKRSPGCPLSSLAEALGARVATGTLPRRDATHSATNTMGAILAMGVPLADVTARSTIAPPREIGQPELGTLTSGSDADVAVLALDAGEFGFVACGQDRLAARQRFRCVLTIRAGQIVFNPDGLGLPSWDSHRRAQRAPQTNSS